jgi:diguanylate cyclase (GGDEF)-like protein/PAS domain S-box-containing protein
VPARRHAIPAAYRALPATLRTFVIGSLAVVLCLMVLIAVGAPPSATFWTRALLTAVSGLATVAVAASVQGQSGRIRRVRVLLAVAIGFWLGGELIRDVEIALGAGPVGAIAHLPFAAVLLCAAGAYVSALRGHVRRREEVALYLDASVVFLACASLLLTTFGHTAARSISGGVDLLYAIFFIATMGATLLLDLTVRAERRPHGAYVILLGLVLLGTGFLWRLAAPGTPIHEAGPPALFLTLGVVVIMLGAITWTDARDDDERYVRLADRLRALLPPAAVVVAAVLALIQVSDPAPGLIGALNGVAMALILPAVAARQTVMLADRERAIGRERQLSGELAAAERQYRTLVERQPGIVYLAEAGPVGRWHYVSPQIQRILGFAPQAWLDDPGLWARQLHPDDRSDVLDAETAPKRWTTAGTTTLEYRLRAADGRYVWVLQDESVVRAADGVAGALVQGVLLDITERKRAEEALRASEEQKRTIIETASYAFIGMDTDGRVIDWNQHATNTFGWNATEAMGRLVADLIIPEAQRRRHAAGLQRFLVTGDGPLVSRRVEVVALHRDGREFPIELTIWPVTTDGVTRFNALIDDITVRKELEDQLRHQALHDSLTGLANRVLFTDRVQHALDRCAADPGRSIAVVFLDLDDFKTVNDSLGHAAGDELLTRVAERLSGLLRTEDTAARLGGDEFAVLLEDVATVDLDAIVSRVVQRLSRPFDLDGKVVWAAASVGVSVSGDHGGEPQELLRNADLAMYFAKARGKNRYEFYAPGMHEQAVRRLDMKASLERAIEDGELEVHYQPIVRIADGTISGVEALLRWMGPDGDYVPLPELIAIAEGTGLMVPIGRFVLERATSDVREWRRGAGSPQHFDVAVNVSVTQLEHGTLLRDVAHALDLSGLGPESLVVEITEGALTTDSLDTVRTLRSLRKYGVRLALDDFGTGYSSLDRLRRFPVDIVKIDRGFVAGVTRERDGALVQSIIDLGQSLSMAVVAEGVETNAQAIALHDRGVVFGQGYYYSRPVPAEAMPALLAGGQLPLRRHRVRAVTAHTA